MGDHHQQVAVELILDFDGTITTADTIASLAKAAIELQVKNRGRSRSEMASAWAAIEQAYAHDLREYQNTYVYQNGKQTEQTPDSSMATLRPVQGLEGGTPLDIIMDRLSCRQRRHIELASLARVKDEGVFKGVQHEDLFSAGQQDRSESRVRLREGFDPFITQAKKKHDVHVLSVNWSASYINGVLSGYDMASVLANTTNPEDGRISASQAGFENLVPRGHWPEVLTVARDKVVALRHLYWRQKLLKPDENLQFIYFGDSATDFECLKEVGGVILSNDEGGSLLRMLRKELAYQIPHVSQWTEGEFICWARDFNELSKANYLARRVFAAENNG
ncbi:hypothetical protein VPNG_07564 [Cytospora leucostoma]|uniref:Uncharacterized protein n=1 Tax=Cytospora leucostoma TaxID=1230097 RepID=A0A423WDF8_9PEZI|nr:hypothetical protein VPNG_07564 [Cytospora leucostoma]